MRRARVVDREDLGRGGHSRGPVELRIHLEADTTARSQSGARLHVGGGREEGEGDSANLPKTASPVPMSGFSSAPCRGRDDDNARSTAAHTSAAAAAALHFRGIVRCPLAEIRCGPNGHGPDVSWRMLMQWSAAVLTAICMAPAVNAWAGSLVCGLSAQFRAPSAGVPARCHGCVCTVCVVCLRVRTAL